MSRLRMDIHESPESNLVTATVELPGLKKEDVSVDIRNNRLVVSGEVNTSKEYKENGYIHRERSTGKFSRTLPLPAGTKVSTLLCLRAGEDGEILTVDSLTADRYQGVDGEWRFDCDVPQDIARAGPEEDHHLLKQYSSKRKRKRNGPAL